MAGGEPETFVGLSWSDSSCATGESLQRTDRGRIVKKVPQLPSYQGTGSQHGTYHSKGRIKWK